MNRKKIFIIIASFIVLLGVALFAYFFISSKTKIDGESTMDEAGDLYVYDEDGNIETDPDTGENYVYETDSNGYYVYDEDGEFATQIEGYEASLENEKRESMFPTATINDPGETREFDPTADTKSQENDPEASKAGGDVIGEITLPN